MPNPRRLVLVALISLALGCDAPSVPGPEVTIKLGGQFCEMYPDALTSALQRVEGVETVDLDARKGYAIVRGRAGAMDVAELEAAVNGVKGESWHCEAESIQ